ncbi:MAG TPA: hypothetical protein VHD36_13960 [Pirellulales bacterium]|nr:hypothetical protein [Pirellulales bacterium]
MNGVTTRTAWASLAVVMLMIETSQAQNQASRPRISPYMNLVNNPLAGATNYQSLVRPQIEQMNFNRSQRAAVGQLQRQSAASRSTSTAQGNSQLRGTGHRTVFDQTSRYYPQKRPAGSGPQR